MSDKPSLQDQADDFLLEAIAVSGQHQAALEEVARLKAINADLLAALEDMLADASGHPKSCGHDYLCICPGDNARAAIAKARGE